LYNLQNNRPDKMITTISDSVNNKSTRILFSRQSKMEDTRRHVAFQWNKTTRASVVIKDSNACALCNHALLIDERHYKGENATE